MATRRMAEAKLKASLLQKGSEMAAWYGYSVFIELVKNQGSSEYHGTTDLIEKYAGILKEEENIQLIPADIPEGNGEDKTSDVCKSSVEVSRKVTRSLLKKRCASPEEGTDQGSETKEQRPVRKSERKAAEETSNLQGAQKRKASLKRTQQNLRYDEDDIGTDSDEKTYRAPRRVKRARKTRGAGRKVAKTQRPEKKVFRCETCSKTFKDKWHLNRHSFSHTDEKPFTCDVCGNNYKSPFHLREHLSTHSQDSKHACTDCGKGFKQRNQYEWHVKKFHTPGGKEPFKCSSCGQVFTRKLALRIHREKHASDEEKVFACGDCAEKFASVACLCMHQKSQHGKKRYTCPICGKPSHGLLHMESHVAIHTGEKLFHCEKCGKGYVSEGGLKWHQATHVDERPFKCTQCTAAFYTKYDLQKHVLTHTTERMFVCESCGSQFKSRTNLAEHQKRHRGEVSKTFTCAECGTSFYTLSHLHRHALIHTGEKAYSCGVCGRRYSRQDNLRVHMRTHRIKDTNPKPGGQNSPAANETREQTNTDVQGGESTDNSTPGDQTESSKTAESPSNIEKSASHRETEGNDTTVPPDTGSGPQSIVGGPQSIVGTQSPVKQGDRIEQPINLTQVIPVNLEQISPVTHIQGESQNAVINHNQVVPVHRGQMAPVVKDQVTSVSHSQPASVNHSQATPASKNQIQLVQVEPQQTRTVPTHTHSSVSPHPTTTMLIAVAQNRNHLEGVQPTTVQHNYNQNQTHMGNLQAQPALNSGTPAGPDVFRPQQVSWTQRNYPQHRENSAGQQYRPQHPANSNPNYGTEHPMANTSYGTSQRFGDMPQNNPSSQRDVVEAVESIRNLPW